MPCLYKKKYASEKSESLGTKCSFCKKPKKCTKMKCFLCKRSQSICLKCKPEVLMYYCCDFVCKNCKGDVKRNTCGLIICSQKKHGIDYL